MDPISILVFFVILSILILVHEAGHFIVAKKNGVLVEEFGFGLPPRIFGYKFGETLYSINLLPFGGFVKVLGEERGELADKKLPKKLYNRTFVGKSHGQKIAIIAAGVIGNFLLGWFIVSYLFTIGIPVPTKNIYIQDIAKKSPAEISKLKVGDEIKSISADSHEYKLDSTEDLFKLSRKYAGKNITLNITRNKQSVSTNIVPRDKPPQGQGPLGITISSLRHVQYPWYQAPFFGLIESFKMTATIAQELTRALFSLLTFQKVKVDVAGPLGIAKITSQAVSFGYIAVLQLLGILSLNLAVINILPFPALDGGRLTLVLYEAITKKKVNPEFERKLNIAGFAILLSLILIVTINDLIKLFVK